MLQELRKNEFVTKQPWKRSAQRGLCANRDCVEEAKDACSRCGLKYCCSKCQKADWKARHKHHCEVTNLNRTKIIFNIHKQRLDEFKSGKSSFDRYYSIGMESIYKTQFPLRESVSDPVPYRVIATDEASGRILTVVEDHEQGFPSFVLCRGIRFYLINTSVPSVPLTEEEKQARMQCGLSVRDAVEVIPINENLQVEFHMHKMAALMKNMRDSWQSELMRELVSIDMIISPGMGFGYGNPVLLSLQNVLAYEDYIQKTFTLCFDRIPINIMCSILFPNEFKISMRTGNTDDDDKYLDTSSEDKFVQKSDPMTGMAADYALLLDRDLAEKEYQLKRQSLEHREGESEEERIKRQQKYIYYRTSWKYIELDMTVGCSDSLAVCPADRMCFNDSRNQPTSDTETFSDRMCFNDSRNQPTSDTETVSVSEPSM